MSEVGLYAVRDTRYSELARAWAEVVGAPAAVVDVRAGSPSANDLYRRTGQRGVPAFAFGGETVVGFQPLALQAKAGAHAWRADRTKLLDASRRVLSRGPADHALQDVVDLLTAALPHFSWTGIYRVEGGDLVLRSWRGPKATEHTRIPVGQGLCGLAAREGQTVNVPDVRADPRYLACFLDTRSEIVVPVLRAGRVVGEIDVDSNRPAAFTPDDERLLEELAKEIAQMV